MWWHFARPQKNLKLNFIRREGSNTVVRLIPGGRGANTALGWLVRIVLYSKKKHKSPQKSFDQQNKQAAVHFLCNPCSNEAWFFDKLHQL